MISFSELNLSAPVLKAIEELGFEKASPIQAETLPILLGEPTDFLGLAATGTGKTAAFAIPMIERLDATKREVQALILCPTRELALQVGGQVNDLGRHKGVRTAAVYGGSSFGEQVRRLQDGATVVIGTPGRVLDHLERGTLSLESLQTIIFDEADEMISMGFKDDLEKILESAPLDHAKFWMFSATMSSEVRRVGDKFLRDPKQVHLNEQKVLSATVEQLFYPVQESDKAEVLCKLVEAADEFYGLVFCQTKALVADLTIYMKDRGFQVDCLHGDMDQTSRERTMLHFRERRVKILVCTDVASRGLDVKDITHVINYSLPRELDNYVHRIGRTARSGKNGVAMNLVTYSHRHLIGRIERMTKSRMVEGRIPTRREIATKKVTAMLPKFLDQPYQDRAQQVLSLEWVEAVAEMTPEEIVARFVAMNMPDIFNDRPEGAPKKTAGFRERDDQRDEKPRYQREGKPRFERRERPRFDNRDEAPRFARDDKPRFEDRAERVGKPRFDRERPRFEKRDGFEGGVEGRKPYFKPGFKPKFQTEGDQEFKKPSKKRFESDEKPAFKPNYKEGFKAEGGKFRRDREDRFAAPTAPFKKPFKPKGFVPKGDAARLDRPPRARFSRDNGSL